MKGGQVFYPQVNQLPAQKTERPGNDSKSANPKIAKEFDQAFDKALSQEALRPNVDLNQIKKPLKFSAHATQRLRERGISIASDQLAKIDAAVGKAEAKGVEDTLVLTDEAALIVNVKNKTVVTAMDRENLNENVFTNIDGAVIVSN